MKWEELREEEFKGAVERTGGLCVIPLGCTEVHGQHLPVGADYYEAMGFAEKAAELEEVMIFPTGFWLGDVGGAHAVKDPLQKGVAGQIAISPELQLRALTEICDEIARNGFRKILILNSHGGNVALLQYFVRAHAYEGREYATMWSWAPCTDSMNPKKFYDTVMAEPEKFPYLTEEDYAVMARFAETGTGGGHADYNEAAWLLHMVPELVRLDRCTATSGLSTHRADYLDRAGVKADFSWPSNYPNMYSGYDPIGVTANIGRAMVDISARRLARIFKMLKEDEDCVRMAKGLPQE